MIAGIAVGNIGHNHPAVVDAVKKQIDRHMHVMVYGEYIQPVQNRLAEKLVSLLPAGLEKVYFVNSGTEANEAALKLAKRATGRKQLISFEHSYHGNTQGSLSVTGNPKKRSAFEPLLPGVSFLKFNDTGSLNAITNDTAAVITEVIQGDAGIRPATQEFLQALRQRCNETGALLIFDEIQTGFGRTGHWFAFEHYGIAPDILTIAKAFGGGMPIGALVASRTLLDKFTYNPMLGHITTFGGHPVNCAAALANLEVIENEIDFDEVERKGALIESLLRHPAVKAIRRKGLFIAVELESEQAVQKVFEHCLENGVLIFWFLSTAHAFRLSPPLNITDKEIEHGCKVICEGFDLL